MDEDMKKPCSPREEMSRDYNELGLYPRGETVKTATELWEMLPCWMEARRMAFIDPEYNRRMSEFIAQRPPLFSAPGAPGDRLRLRHQCLTYRWRAAGQQARQRCHSHSAELRPDRRS